METSKFKQFEGGSFRDRPVGKGIYACMPMNALRRLAQRYEYGQLKYGKAAAYKDGLPVSDTCNSIFRHVIAYLEGDNSEDHMAAIAWNAFCVMYMEECRPQFQDVESRATINDFNYIERAIKEGVK